MKIGRMSGVAAALGGMFLVGAGFLSANDWKPSWVQPTRLGPGEKAAQMFQSRLALNGITLTFDIFQPGPQGGVTVAVRSPTVTVRIDRAIIDGICARVVLEFADELSATETSETILFGAYARRQPVTINVHYRTGIVSPFTNPALSFAKTTRPADAVLELRPDNTCIRRETATG